MAVSTFDELCEELKKQFGDIEVRRPEDPTHFHFITFEVQFKKPEIVGIEWKSGKGYGVVVGVDTTWADEVYCDEASEVLEYITTYVEETRYAENSEG